MSEWLVQMALYRKYIKQQTKRNAWRYRKVNKKNINRKRINNEMVNRKNDKGSNNDRQDTMQSPTNNWR